MVCVRRVFFRDDRLGDASGARRIAQPAGAAGLEDERLDLGEAAVVLVQRSVHRHVTVRRRRAVRIERKRRVRCDHDAARSAVGHVARIDRGVRVRNRVPVHRHRGGRPVSVFEADFLRSSDYCIRGERDVPHDERLVVGACNFRIVRHSAQAVGPRAGDCEIVICRIGPCRAVRVELRTVHHLDARTGRAAPRVVRVHQYAFLHDSRCHAVPANVTFGRGHHKLSLASLVYLKTNPAKIGSAGRTAAKRNI